MKKQVITLIMLFLSSMTFSQEKDSISRFVSIIKSHVYKDYKKMYRPGSGALVI